MIYDNIYVSDLFFECPASDKQNGKKMTENFKPLKIDPNSSPYAHSNSVCTRKALTTRGLFIC